MLSIDGVTNLLNDKKRDYAPYNPVCKGIYYGMSLHTSGACPSFSINEKKYIPTAWYGVDYDWLFNNFIYNRHPRETEVTRNLRLSWHKPFTKAPFLKSIEVITGGIFQDNNYSITLADKKDNDYIWGNNFDQKNIAGYFSGAFKSIVEDPNGFFIVLPKDPYYDTTTPDIEPVIWFINSFQIVALTDEEIVFEREDYGWHVNEFGIFRYEKDDKGKYSLADNANGGYYPHLFGNIPIIIAGGVWNNKGFYDSWLDKAKPLADEYLTSYSDLQLSDKDVTYPWTQVPAMPCPNCSGTGLIHTALGSPDDKIEQCARCKGQGEIYNHNPGEFLVTPKDYDGTDLVKFYAAPIDGAKHLTERCSEIMQDLEKALHLNFIEEAQSAIAKDKDMESRDLLSTKIANDLFDRIIPQCIYYITGYRNVSGQDGNLIPAPVYPVIVKPTQFAIQTESELQNIYKATVESNMPDFVKAVHLNDYLGKRYDSDNVLIKMSQVIMDLDILAVTPEQDKLAKVNGGAISNRDWQYSVYLPNIIKKLIRDRGDKWFLSAQYDEIKMLSDTEFAKVPEFTLPQAVVLPKDGIPTLNNAV